MLIYIFFIKTKIRDTLNNIKSFIFDIIYILQSVILVNVSII